MKKLLSLTFFFLLLLQARAQDPVQVTAQLLPPYSLYVSDYYTPAAGQKLNLLLLNRDLARPTIQVRLRMTIESQSVRLRTKELPATALNTFTLTAGVPLYVQPAELAAYFNAANLDFSGINAADYQGSGKLPEGFYTFCFEAIEVNSGLAVSRSGCAFAWMTLSDPPLLNIPSCGEELLPVNPQNVLFNWTPRHAGSPTAAFNIEYEFSITELTDAMPSPESAFYSGVPLYTGTTAATTFLYSPDLPQLQPNKRYAWRVRAVAKQGGQELAQFKNNGYSAVCWFQYRSNCPPILGISHAVTGTRATISWTPNAAYLEYKVQYRQVADSLGEWFNAVNTIPQVVLYDLKAFHQYEYRVGASCEFGVFNFSEKKYFSTGDSNQSFVADCGVDGTVPPPTGSNLTTLNTGDIIHAGDFTVHVTDVTSGTVPFSGAGYTSVPWLAGVKIGVTFNNITANTDYKLTAGVIKTTYDPQWSGIIDVDGFLEGGGNTGQVITGNITTGYTAGFPITNPGQVGVTTNANGSATIIITGPGGQTATYTAASLPATLQDNLGNIYTVSNTNPPSVTQSATSGGQAAIAKLNPKTLDADKGRVTFMPPADAAKMIYAFDAWQPVYAKSTAFNNEYERLATGAGGSPYYVSAKAIAPALPDVVRAKVTLTDATLTMDSLQFISSKGTVFTKMPTGTAGEYEISLVGGPADDAQEIYACYKQSSGKTLNLGKLLVASYGKKKINLVLVPINNTLVNKDPIVGKLREVYNQINIEFNVTVDDNLNFSDWDIDGDAKLDVTGSANFSGYTAEMKKLNAGYKSRRKINNGTIYLFCLLHAKDSVSNQNILGDMPRGSKYGYLFFGNGNVDSMPLTVSHEIGHGLFNLKHVFDYSGVEKKDIVPANIMDYPNGTMLSKMQWDRINDPALLILNLDESEDGENYIFSIEEKFKNSDNASVSFLAMNGTVISLPFDNLGMVEFSYGSVASAAGGSIQNLSYNYEIVPTCLMSFYLKENGTYKKYVYHYPSKKYLVDGTQNFYQDNWDYTKVQGFISLYPNGADLTLYKLSKNNLSKYSPSGTALNFTDYANLIVPFSTSGNYAIVDADNKFIKQTRPIEPNLSKLWLASEATAQMALSHAEKPELLFIDKIAQLRNVYPDYFKRFTQEENWEMPKPITRYVMVNDYTGTTETTPITNWVWGNYVTMNPQLIVDYNANTNLTTYFRTFCEQLNVYIESQITINAAFWSNLSPSTTAASIVQHLKQESILDTKEAPLDKRKTAIKTLMDDMVPEIIEDAIIQLLTATKESEQTVMLQYIAGTIKLKKIFEKFDDSHFWIGKDNFTKVVTLISSWIEANSVQAVDQTSIAKLGEESEEMVAIDADLFGNRQADGSFIDDNNEVNFYNKVRRAKDPLDDPRMPAFVDDVVFLKVPYDKLIPVDFWTEFQLGDRTYERKRIAFMPALQVALIHDKSCTEILSKYGWLAFDAITLPLGVGEVTMAIRAGSWLRGTVALASVIGTSGSIINEVVSEEYIPADIKRKIRIGCALLQLPEAIRSVSTIVKTKLKKTAETAEQYADDINISPSAKEKLLEFSSMVNAEGDFAGDAAEISNRVVNLGNGEDLAHAKTWLASATGGQVPANKVFIIAHSDGSTFKILTQSGEEVNITHRSLAKWFAAKNYPNDYDLVLLSCNDLQSAQNLSNKLGRAVTASDGRVAIHSDGGISSDREFVILKPGQPKVISTKTPFKIPGAGSSKVILGNWDAFVDGLDWPVELVAALRKTLDEVPALKKMFATVPNKDELAESWRLLYSPNNSSTIALFRNDKAILALTKIKKNPNLPAFPVLTDSYLSGLRGWGWGNNGLQISYDQVIMNIDRFITNTVKNDTRLINADAPLFKKFLSKSPQQKQGAYWIMEDIATNKQLFGKKVISFEVTVGQQKRIDAVVMDAADAGNVNKGVWTEYKWYSEANKTIDQKSFVGQFVERDLMQRTDLSKLQWRIKGSQLSYEKCMEYLQSQEGLDALKQIPAANANAVFGVTTFTNVNKEAIANAYLDYFLNTQLGRQRFNNIFFF